MEVGFESTNQDFCDHFVESIAQTNGAKLVNGFRFGCFGDKAKEGGIKLLENVLGSGNVLYARGNQVTHNILESLKENWVEAICSRSFEGFKGEDCFFNFQVSDILKEKVMNVDGDVVEVWSGRGG